MENQGFRLCILLFSLLKYTLNSARLFPLPLKISLIALIVSCFTYRQRVSLVHTLFFTFYLSLLSLLYTSKNLSPLAFHFSFSQSRLEPYLFEVAGEGKSKIFPLFPLPTSCLRCVKLNLPLIIIITFNMYISSIFLSFCLYLHVCLSHPLHKTALSLSKSVQRA